MAMSAAEIEQAIREVLPDAQISIEDLAGDGDHYRATIVSAEFRGKTRLQQHQMVYKALGDLMHRQIHALSIKTFAPGESE